MAFSSSLSEEKSFWRLLEYNSDLFYSEIERRRAAKPRLSAMPVAFVAGPLCPVMDKVRKAGWRKSMQSRIAKNCEAYIGGCTILLSHSTAALLRIYVMRENWENTG